MTPTSYALLLFRLTHLLFWFIKFFLAMQLTCCLSHKRLVPVLPLSKRDSCDSTETLSHWMEVEPAQERRGGPDHSHLMEIAKDPRQHISGDLPRHQGAFLLAPDLFSSRLHGLQLLDVNKWSCRLFLSHMVSCLDPVGRRKGYKISRPLGQLLVI